MIYLRDAAALLERVSRPEYPLQRSPSFFRAWCSAALSRASQHCLSDIYPPRCRHTDVGALNGGLWGLEAQSDVLVPSATVLASAGGLDLNLGVKEDVWLLLEGALSLDGQFGGHFCGWWMSRWSKVVGIEIGLVVVELLLHRMATLKRTLLGLENPVK